MLYPAKNLLLAALGFVLLTYSGISNAMPVGPVEVPNQRAVRACQSLFSPVETPFFYGLRKGDKISYLIGSAMGAVTFAQLPKFVQQTIEGSKVLVTLAPVNDSELYRKMQLEIDNGNFLDRPPLNIESKIAPEAAALMRKILEPLHLDDEYYVRLTALELYSHVALAFDHKLIDDAAIQRGNEIDNALAGLDPEASLDEFIRLLSLDLQITDIAKHKGAKVLLLESKDFADKVARQMDDPVALEKLVFTLDRALKTGIKAAVYAHGDIKEYDALVEISGMLNPANYNRLIEFVEKWTGSIESIHKKEQVPLFSMDMGVLAGPYGLLKALQNTGFEVKQLKTEEQWRAFKAN